MNLIKLFLLTICTSFLACTGQMRTERAAPTTTGNHSESDFPGPGKGIMVVFQDSKNNYWFGGTQDGVYRYDGQTLQLFTSQNGLPSHRILGIQEDKSGHLYFDTDAGVSRYDGHTFTTLEIRPSRLPKKDWKLEENDLWFRMGWDHSGPFRYDGENLRALEFPKAPLEDNFYEKFPNSSYSPYGIYSMYVDQQGNRWFGTASLGWCRFDGTNFSWLYEEQMAKTPEGGDFGFRSLAEDRDGAFWFCNAQYRYEVFPTPGDTIAYNRQPGISVVPSTTETSHPYFLSMTKGPEGDLWMVSYDEGVWRNTGTELIHYPVLHQNKQVLLFSIYQDRQGTLWAGSHEAGVYRFNGSAFERFFPGN